eukprot:comp24301_c0_seq1/m.45587 comp24301_c0_seq1/g.45587  ORF comp24301_c0_seq1/g.45587 comp24301_c0_seq1/m.45587 type:complete len:1734 (-) comp24301_c0_seq1:245-5446(-)
MAKVKGLGPSYLDEQNRELLYTKGAKVWIEDMEEGWVQAEILSVRQSEVILNMADGTRGIYKRGATGELPPLCNDDSQSLLDNLTSLNYLNEASVLHCLHTRFPLDIIYTYSGIVLVAVNPFKPLPSLYSDEMVANYRGQHMGQLEPHLYAVAEDAYQRLQRDKQSQAIIVSGESGAGKTVSAKLAMRYLAAVGGMEASKGSTKGGIETQIMATTPILEALGNAKTTRNDNSSRFGKFMQIQFNKANRIVGAEIRTYLLEKSRVVLHTEGERGYHIFYNLLAGLSDKKKTELYLTKPNDFHYTRQGLEGVEGVDDAESLREVRQAFRTINLSKEDEGVLFRLLAGILHLGNVVALRPGVLGDSASLQRASKLLGVPTHGLATWLSHKRLVAGKEVLNRPMSQTEIVDARDGMAKAIYTKLFDWVVGKINQSLNRSNEGPVPFIGLLDIYGFEHFPRNSFEQFCINYANENLQQQFTQYVFHQEQDMYRDEEIRWSFIGFTDNAPCLDLIEGKNGIFSLLDEECQLTKGSDANWAEKMYGTFSNHEFFSKPRLCLKGPQFTIKHYACPVTYDCGGFQEKNKDRVPEELMAVIRASSDPLLRELFPQPEPEPVTEDPRRPLRKTVTVGFLFRKSLQDLMSLLALTNTHYVRCIKPNLAGTPDHFDRLYVQQQLRACGVLDTIRISAAGYPTKMSYNQFYDRFNIVYKGESRANRRAICEQVLSKLLAPDQYQLGRTMIFLRAGTMGLIEKNRNAQLDRAATKIQSMVRRWVATKKFLRMRLAALCVQTFFRGYSARKKVGAMVQERAATRIQAIFRGYLVRRSFETNMEARRRQARLRAQAKRFIARCRYVKTRRLVIFIQACVRRKLAMRKLAALKREDNDVTKIKAQFQQKTYEMEMKIMSMQMEWDKERAQWTTKDRALRRDLADTIRQLEAAAVMAKKLSMAEREIESLKRKNKRLEEKLQRAEDAATAVATAAYAMGPQKMPAPKGEAPVSGENMRKRLSVFGSTRVSTSQPANTPPTTPGPVATKSYLNPSASASDPKPATPVVTRKNVLSRVRILESGTTAHPNTPTVSSPLIPTPATTTAVQAATRSTSTSLPNSTTPTITATSTSTTSTSKISSSVSTPSLVSTSSSASSSAGTGTRTVSHSSSSTMASSAPSLATVEEKGEKSPAPTKRSESVVVRTRSEKKITELQKTLLEKASQPVRTSAATRPPPGPLNLTSISAKPVGKTPTTQISSTGVLTTTTTTTTPAAQNTSQAPPAAAATSPTPATGVVARNKDVATNQNQRFSRLSRGDLKMPRPLTTTQSGLHAIGGRPISTLQSAAPPPVSSNRVSRIGVRDSTVLAGMTEKPVHEEPIPDMPTKTTMTRNDSVMSVTRNENPEPHQPYQVFRYSPDDTKRLVSTVITSLTPDLAGGRPMPAYVMSRCIRYDVFNQRTEQLPVLSILIHTAIKDIFLESSCPDRVSFMLASSVHLCGTLLSDREEVRRATQKLTQQLSGLVTFGYRVLVSIIEKALGDDVIALLEYNPNEKGSILRRLTGRQRTTQDVLNHLSLILATLRKNCLPDEYVNSLVMRMMDFIGTQVTQRLTMYRDLCTWRHAGVVEMNISQLAEWLYVNGYDWTYAERLMPIQQAVDLLKAGTKLPQNMPEVNNLSISQVRKLLQNFHGEYGEKVWPTVITATLDDLNINQTCKGGDLPGLTQLQPPPMDYHERRLPQTDIPAQVGLGFIRELYI